MILESFIGVLLAVLCLGIGWVLCDICISLDERAKKQQQSISLQQAMRKMHSEKIKIDQEARERCKDK